jgi:hypothetical protein
MDQAGHPHPLPLFIYIYKYDSYALGVKVIVGIAKK